MNLQLSEISLQILAVLYEMHNRKGPPMSVEIIREEIFGQFHDDYDDEVLGLELRTLADKSLVEEVNGEWIGTDSGIPIGLHYALECEYLYKARWYNSQNDEQRAGYSQ